MERVRRRGNRSAMSEMGQKRTWNGRERMSAMPAKVDPGRQLNICLHLPEVSGVQLPSTHAPADDRRFDWAVGIHTLPRAATPSAQEWNDIGADVIFAKKFMWLVRRRNTLVSEGADSLLPCGHRSRVSLLLEFDAHTWPGASRRRYIRLKSA